MSFFSSEPYPNSENAQISIGECVNRIESNDLQRPSYQRELVWSMKQKIAYLENISKGAPIYGPVINIDTSSEIQYIMDGQNRLWTIYEFVNDAFPYKIDSTKIKFSEMSKAEQRKFKNIKISYTETRDWSEKCCTEYFQSIQDGEKLKKGELIHASTENILHHKIKNISNEFYDFFKAKAGENGFHLSPASMKRYGHYEIIGTLIHMCRTNEYPLRPGQTAYNELLLWDNKETDDILDTATTNVATILRMYQEIVKNVPRIREGIKKEEHLRLLYLIFRANIFQREITDDDYARFETLLNTVTNDENKKQIIIWGTGDVESIYLLYYNIYHQ